MELNDKIAALKKNIFLDSKRKFYESIFGTSFISIIPFEDFFLTDINLIISFIENTKIRKNEYRILPSIIIKNDNKANNGIENNIREFFDCELVYLLFSNIIESNIEIDGYASILKESFVINLNRLSLNYAFIISSCYKKFIYYSTSKDSEKIYLYKGVITNEKFIRILN